MPDLLARRDGRVLLLAHNRPERFNAWTYDLGDLYFDLELAREGARVTIADLGHDRALGAGGVIAVRADVADWEREIQINLWGMLNCTRAVPDGMIARRAGSVVSIASDAGRIGELREGV